MFEKILREHAERLGDRVAMRIKRDGTWREWTHRDLWNQARSAAARLHELGVSRGDRVALFADNSPEWVLAYFGIYLSGATVVPLDALFTDREVRTILGFAGCRAIIRSPAKSEIVEAVRTEAGIRDVIDLDDPKLFAGQPLETAETRGPDELMSVIFTSGTTGDPKGVCLTAGNFLSNVKSLLALDLVTEKDNFLSVLPLHHCYAFTVTALLPLSAGATTTFCASLRGPHIIETMRETGVTAFPCVPRILEGFDRAISDQTRRMGPWKRHAFRAIMRFSRKMRRMTGVSPGKLLFRSVHHAFGPKFRFFVSGGAKLDHDVCARLLDLGVNVIEGYGLTETAPVATLNPLRKPRPGSVGRPIPGEEVKIDAPGPDAVGEVLIRGPNVMQGYDRRPAETAAVLRDGWLRTGDLGYLDKDGYLHIAGRLKEVIVMASGKNVYPEDVERAYLQSPLVREICVMPVGSPNGRVERLRAVVLPNFDELNRRKASNIRDEVRRSITMLAQGLPSYMHITDLKLVTTEMPKTRLGKLRRAEIQRMAFEEVAEGAAEYVSPEDEALIATSQAKRLVAALRDVTVYTGRILPGSHLEIDLGIDSLGRVGLAVALEREFEVTIPEGELAEAAAVRDVLKLLSGKRERISAPAGWSVFLRQRPSPPLSEMFNRRRGPVARSGLDALRRCALRVSQRAFPLDVRGLERLPKNAPFLLCPTHASFIDPVLIYMSVPDDLVDKLIFLGAKERFASPVMRWVARTARVVLTGTTDTALVSMQRAAEALESGRPVCVFPEGFISRDGNLQPPQPGAGILACEMRVPLVPVLVRGTFDILSYAHPGFRLRPVGLTFSEPIEPPLKAHYAAADYKEIMSRWQRAIVRLRLEDDASGSRTAGRSPRIPEDLI